MATTNHEARLNFRVPVSLKRTIEEAAARLGQTVSDFAVATLSQTARKVLNEQNITRLSERDRKLVMALLDDPSAKPNKALVAAARRYKKQVR